MIQGIYTILTNEALTPDMMKLVLAGDTSALTAAGQFVDVKLDGFFLRRPISVCDWNKTSLTLLYKKVGHGTETLAALPAGAKLDLLTGLGNGFQFAGHGTQPVLIGGGAGVPPMYALAKALKATGIQPQVILGFNTEGEIYYRAEFEALGVPLHIATADGSVGTRGFVTDVLKTLSYDYFYTCGPMPMYRAIEKIVQTSGQYSFEERMGCGFGACMGCSCQTKDGSKRLCKDGPVLMREEIVWEN